MSLKRLFVVGALAVGAAAWHPGQARAFCGFFVAGSDAKLTNNASQVVMLRKGNRTVMTMSNTYQGPPQDFAMVVPVPVVLKKEDVRTLPADVFDKVDSLTAPRLVEYWEQDPCRSEYYPEEGGQPAAKALAGRDEEMDDSDEPRKRDLGVRVEARFVTGEYEVVILSAKESGGLETWLRLGHYNVPRGAAAALAPYVRDRAKFFVAKVDIKKVQRNAAGMVQLSPLRFSFDDNQLRLPVRLGLLNASGKQDLIVYIVHPTARFEVANYSNAFIPTNLEVGEPVSSNFPAFFAELFDATVERMGRKVVITEYAWQTTSCDPCPTPPLSLDELSSLGMDVLEGIGAAPPEPPMSMPGSTKPSVIAREQSASTQARPAARFVGPQPSWVITRLHARYDKESLSEDLVFREAPPVIGGRAGWNGGIEGDAGPQVVRDSSVDNNFQGRYIIRHYWTGPIACQNPRFESWGGPTDGSYSGAPQAAKGLATAPRGKIALKTELRSPVPLLGIAGKPPVRRKTAP